jgi:hypothetical protein
MTEMTENISWRGNIELLIYIYIIIYSICILFWIKLKNKFKTLSH